MQTVSTIGLDIAKSVFQVHGVDANGVVVIRRQSKRRYVLAFFEKLPSCLVGIEACASSHHWSQRHHLNEDQRAWALFHGAIPFNKRRPWAMAGLLARSPSDEPRQL
jgi:hypothetical protein